MRKKFDYLEKFLPPHPTFEGTNRNWFCLVSKEEILEAEKKYNFCFPNQLREFYSEIGYGSLYAAYNAPIGYRAFMSNKILPPLVAAAFYKPLEGDNRPEDEYVPINAGDDAHYMAAMTYEMLQPGDLPFFEVGDGTNFLVMRPHSENPNAVWSDCGVKIEDSFERFIWRLYHEDPAYYGDIIDAHYNTLENGG